MYKEIVLPLCMLMVLPLIRETTAWSIQILYMPLPVKGSLKGSHFILCRCCCDCVIFPGWTHCVGGCLIGPGGFVNLCHADLQLLLACYRWNPDSPDIPAACLLLVSSTQVSFGLFPCWQGELLILSDELARMLWLNSNSSVVIRFFHCHDMCIKHSTTCSFVFTWLLYWTLIWFFVWIFILDFGESSS